MGYEILIGELVRDPPPGVPGWPAQTVSVIEQPDAPCFDGDATGPTNRRVYDYLAWHAFMRTSGLWGIFHGPGGLFARHPDTVRLTRRHAMLVRQALELFAAARPHARPTFETGEPADHHLAQMKWLVWWMEWALANCAVPAIHNR
jgi:hypothetical protein